MSDETRRNFDRYSSAPNDRVADPFGVRVSTTPSVTGAKAFCICCGFLFLCLTVMNILGVGLWNPRVIRNAEYIVLKADEVAKSAEKVKDMYLRREDEISTVHTILNEQRTELLLHRGRVSQLSKSLEKIEKELEEWEVLRDRIKRMAWDVDDHNLEMKRSSNTVEVSSDYPDDRLPPGVNIEDARPEDAYKKYVYLSIDLGNGREQRIYPDKIDSEGNAVEKEQGPKDRAPE